MRTALYCHPPFTVRLLMLGSWIPLQSNWERASHSSLPLLLKHDCRHGALGSSLGLLRLMLSLLFLPLEMNICNKPSNKTAPEKNVWTAPAQASGPSPELQGQRSRRNGWSWPPHPLQIVAWLLYLFFAVIGFGVLVPLLPHHWVPAGYAVSLGKCGAGTWESADSGWRDMGKA